MSGKQLIPFLILAATAGAARADATADFMAGTTVKLRRATVDLGNGSRSSSGSVAIRKESGTLDFDIHASDLGVPVPIVIRLRGTALGHGWIEYAVDDAYSPPVELGGKQTVSSISGRIYMLAAPLPGTTRQDIGNVVLTLAEGSKLEAKGSFGALGISITRLDFLGGVVQPALSGFSDLTRTPICSAAVPTDHRFAVTLADVARAGGAVVELTSPPAGVRFASATAVRAGSRSATVTARIDAKFVGTVHVTAASGGVARSLDVVVRSPSSCLTR